MSSTGRSDVVAHATQVAVLARQGLHGFGEIESLLVFPYTLGFQIVGCGTMPAGLGWGDHLPIVLARTFDDGVALGEILQRDLVTIGISAFACQAEIGIVLGADAEQCRVRGAPSAPRRTTTPTLSGLVMPREDGGWMFAVMESGLYPLSWLAWLAGPGARSLGDEYLCEVAAGISIWPAATDGFGEAGVAPGQAGPSLRLDGRETWAPRRVALLSPAEQRPGAKRPGSSTKDEMAPKPPAESQARARRRASLPRRRSSRPRDRPSATRP